jgi:predicted dehydrogenase
MTPQRSRPVRPVICCATSGQGRYHDLYSQFAAAAAGNGTQPVPAAEGVRTLVVLDAARLSAEQGRAVTLTQR